MSEIPESVQTQARLPGYRDRIAVIRLTDEEGGLNLSMPKSRILALAGYGREADIEFVRRFSDCHHLPGVQPAKSMNWENLQLIRLSLLIASLSEMLGCLKKTDDALRANPQQYYQRFFTPQELGADGEIEPARQSPINPENNAPKPLPELKLKPRI